MDMRISLVTLGVTDLDRSRAFYAALGWTPAPSPDGITFYQAGGMVVALWERSALAIDSGTQDLDRGGWGGVTLALNVTSPGDVDQLITEAEDAGARVVRPRPARTGVATRACSVTPTTTRGRSPTTRTGPSPRTAAPSSTRSAGAERPGRRLSPGPVTTGTPGRRRPP